MKFGLTFPHDIGSADVVELRELLDAAVAAGFRYVTVSDHVAAADPAVHRDWPGPYDLTRPTLEIGVTLGFVAAWSELDVAAGIIVLPTRSAALVAKQAATLDRLTEGRFRLGVGLGWSPVEFEAMGAPWPERGARAEEQIEVMRRLWTEPSVTFTGRFHSFTGAGINPRPIRQPIPVWLASTAARPALERVGRLADGWIPAIAPGPALDAAREVVHEAAVAAGRDPARLGVEGTVTVTDLDAALAGLDAWRAGGATHVAFTLTEPELDARLATLDALSRALADWR